jgi:hypothetical protein
MAVDLGAPARVDRQGADCARDGALPQTRGRIAGFGVDGAAADVPTFVVTSQRAHIHLDGRAPRERAKRYRANGVARLGICESGALPEIRN